MAGIFKAYDVRGLYPDELDEQTAYRVGAAAVSFLAARTLVVGRDNRLSSPALHLALLRGITEAGCDVIDIGLCSTPLNYWAINHTQADGGIMITASHNPAHDNGFKISGRRAAALSYVGGLAEIERLVALPLQPAEQEVSVGRIEGCDLLATYQRWLTGFAQGLRPFTLIVDTGNGVMGRMLPGLFARLPCLVIPMYFELDGSYPHHVPNPLQPENTRDLREAVRRHGADLGIAFDGDGDRVVFIDEKGEAVPGDFMTALLAAEFLRSEPGATILYDLRSSRVVPEEIGRLGGTAVEMRVGHSFIKRTLRERNAAFAGELSGHYYFRDCFFTDNGERAMLAVLSLLHRTGQPLSALVASYARYFATGELNFEVANKQASMAAVLAAFPSANVSRLDGVTLRLPDFWFNVRPSNTEPLLRLNLEARTAALRDALRAKIEAILTRPRPVPARRSEGPPL